MHVIAKHLISYGDLIRSNSASAFLHELESLRSHLQAHAIGLYLCIT
jgi:hypothetical protein